ncbi:LytR/AlgR family response regulator transcription factor [Haliscomenobacter hydrossis]|uniref:Two component transcriptional regulator, LytTR family n=1 Tax=Haliscomenobacter hydrossis (strain ATCC 27775 / DSM 1100 / LMG 10767 / O) TaxID=760192 RepID=F4KRY6_HALH1|nr:LytTR family DNA-binding domain-containing protein [Haliscomenobacter hydrossis]AEE51073.1 two component transcriptional regulator, LytTR family [Haliscomenobacter hydrossis DSM 1100]
MKEVLIIDDEPKAVELLSNYVNRLPWLKCVGTYRNPLEALAFLQKHPVDLLLLDIHMPQISGVEFYRALPQKPKVIFTTAYSEYAVASYELEAIDYLVKPITFERFLQACSRCTKEETTVAAVPESNPQAQEIFIKSGPKLYRLNWEEVLFLEKSENYVVFHTCDRKILSRQNMQDVQEILPDFFCKIHKSYIISLRHLNVVERHQVSIGKHEIPIGQSYRPAFFKILSERWGQDKVFDAV